MRGRQEPEIAEERERLRLLEEALRAEGERIRAAAAAEVAQLQSALRETAARAAERDREVQQLSGELQRAAGPRAARGRRGIHLGRLQPGRGVRDATGALERVLATFERERQKLEERARAVAETERRQRGAAAELAAEAARVEAADRSLGERGRLAAELGAAAKRIEKLERQLREHEETKAALQAARAGLAELEGATDERREAEAALLAARARLAELEGEQVGPPGPAAGAEQEIAEMLVRREEELERRAAAELELRRSELEQEARALLDERERELAERASRELAAGREELERKLAVERERLQAGGDERVDRERSELREEIRARELELARREEDVTAREIELSLLHRRIGDEERRMLERGWRTGALQRRRAAAVVASPRRDVKFSEGWRQLAGGGEERTDGSSRSW